MISLCGCLPLDKNSRWQISLFCAEGFKAFYFHNYSQQILQDFKDVALSVSHYGSD